MVWIKCEIFCFVLYFWTREGDYYSEPIIIGKPFIILHTKLKFRSHFNVTVEIHYVHYSNKTTEIWNLLLKRCSTKLTPDQQIRKLGLPINTVCIHQSNTQTFYGRLIEVKGKLDIILLVICKTFPCLTYYAIIFQSWLPCNKLYLDICIITQITFSDWSILIFDIKKDKKFCFQTFYAFQRKYVILFLANVLLCEYNCDQYN